MCYRSEYIHSQSSFNLLLKNTPFANRAGPSHLDCLKYGTKEIRRHIEGGVVNFKAGCELASLILNPCVRITSKFSAKSDANCVLVSWHHKTIKGPKEVSDILRYHCSPLRFFQRAHPIWQPHWKSVAGFYRAEHALKAVKHCREISRLDATLFFTNYFTAPKEFMDVVLPGLDEVINENGADFSISLQNSKYGMVTLRVAGLHQRKVAQPKRVLKAKFSGHVASIAGREIWYDFFAGPEGKAWLQGLSRDTGSFIRSYRQQQRLRIYNVKRNEEDTSVIEQKLAFKAAELNLTLPTHSFGLDRAIFKRMMRSSVLKEARAKFNKAEISLDVIQKKIVMRCQRRSAKQVAFELNLPLDQLEPSSPMQECLICFDDTEDLIFFACNHAICSDCFNRRVDFVKTDLTSCGFPFSSQHENCQQPIILPDLRKHLPARDFSALFKASLTYISVVTPTNTATVALLIASPSTSGPGHPTYLRARHAWP